MNFEMFKLDLEKAEEPEIKLPTSVGRSRARGRRLPQERLLLRQAIIDGRGGRQRHGVRRVGGRDLKSRHLRSQRVMEVHGREARRRS